MGEVCTPPILTCDDDGDYLVSFGPQHSWADVVRWIAQNEVDLEDVRRLLDEIAAESKEHALEDYI